MRSVAGYRYANSSEGEETLTNSEPTIDEINRDYPDIEAFTYNSMCYAKLFGVVIAAAPDTGELREQICDYFDRTCEASQ